MALGFATLARPSRPDRRPGCALLSPDVSSERLPLPIIPPISSEASKRPTIRCRRRSA